MPLDARAKALEASSPEASGVATDAERPFEDLIAAVALAVGKLGVTPNTLTYMSVVPALACVVAAASGNFVLAVVLMAFSGLCDMLDGPLARVTGRTTRFGALLDSTLDRFADAAPLLGLCVYYSPDGAACLVPAATLFSAYTVSYVRARAEGLSIRLPALWMRRTERLVIIGVALLLAPVKLPFTTFQAPVTLGIVALLGVLSSLAAAHALVTAARILKTGSR